MCLANEEARVRQRGIISLSQHILTAAPQCCLVVADKSNYQYNLCKIYIGTWASRVCPPFVVCGRLCLTGWWHCKSVKQHGDDGPL